MVTLKRYGDNGDWKNKNVQNIWLRRVALKKQNHDNNDLHILLAFMYIEHV